MRLLTVESLVIMASVLSHEEARIHLLEMLKKLCNDKSWRVRYMIAEKLVRVCCSRFGIF